MPRSTRVEVPCAHCGELISRAPSQIAGKKNIFCSRSCHMAFKTAQGTAQVPCDNCGAILTRNRWKLDNFEHQFCDHACHSAFQIGRPLPQNERKVSTPCAYCGEVFTHPQHKKRIYCSRACSAKAIGERVIAENRPARQFVERVQVTCSYCGETVERTPKLAAKFERHFCDRTCKASWNGQHIRGEDHPLYNMVDVTCTQCGAALTRSRAHVKRTHRQFCDPDCYREWRSGRFTGPESGTWKGGNRHHYYGYNWKDQRRKARKRDGYKCQHCGITEKKMGQQLSVHHLIPFRRFGLANYRAANQLGNLISLCNSCHIRAEHRKIPVQPKLL